MSDNWQMIVSIFALSFLIGFGLPYLITSTTWAIDQGFCSLVAGVVFGEIAIIITHFLIIANACLFFLNSKSWLDFVLLAIPPIAGFWLSFLILFYLFDNWSYNKIYKRKNIESLSLPQIDDIKQRQEVGISLTIVGACLLIVFINLAIRYPAPSEPLSTTMTVFLVGIGCLLYRGVQISIDTEVIKSEKN